MQQAVDNYFIQVLDGDVETAFPGIDAKTPGNLLNRRALLHQGEQIPFCNYYNFISCAKIDSYSQQTNKSRTFFYFFYLEV